MATPLTAAELSSLNVRFESAPPAEILRWARSFDVGGGPRARHLVGFEVIDPRHRPDWEELIVHHQLIHEADGSVPLAQDDPPEGNA